MASTSVTSAVTLAVVSDPPPDATGWPVAGLAGQLGSIGRALRYRDGSTAHFSLMAVTTCSVSRTCSASRPWADPSASRQCRYPFIELAARLSHLPHHALQLLDETVDACRDLAEVILAGHREPAGQDPPIALGELLHQVAGERMGL